MATHVKVMNNDQFYGRYAIAFDGDCVSIKKLAGANLPAQLLPSLLEAVNSSFFSIAEEAHKKRTLSWRVVSRSGMSGCRDFYVESRRDSTYEETTRSKKLRVSMYGKLDAELTMRIGDLAPILKDDSYPVWDRNQMRSEGFALEPFYPTSPEHYNAPGTGFAGE